MSDSVIMFIGQIFNGLKIGSVYSLVALGYTMVYGIIRLINFAHGDFIMVGSYALMLTIPFIIACGLPAWFAVIPAVLVCVAVGIIVERAAYKPVREKGNNMTALITAIAMSLLLENGSQALFGADYQTVPTIVEIPTLVLGKLKIDGATIITVLLGIAIMVALQLFVSLTKQGKAMRAVSEDKEASILMGINVDSTITLTFAIGSGLAAVAALMYCISYPQVSPMMGAMLGLKAFVAAVLGGIGSIPGAMVGGLLIGVAESLTKAYIGTITAGVITSAFSDAIVFGILIIVLLLAIIVRCLIVAREAPSRMESLVCVGMAGMLIFQTIANIGMCLFLLPVIGLTLPFFSYGGSSIVTLFAAMGVVSGIKKRSRPEWLIN